MTEQVEALSLKPCDLFSLAGKTAVLTGAGGFLGRTMALALLSAGARVVALGRSDRLVGEVERWRAQFGTDRVGLLHAALDEPAELEAVGQRIRDSEARVDVLVNNAHQLDVNSGFNTLDGVFERMDATQWSRHVDGGAWWAAQLIQALGPQLKDARGSVVNVSSMYGIVAPSPHLYSGTDKVNPVGYSVAKAALLALTRYVASYWGEYGVRVNALLPGPFSNVGGDTDNSVDADDPFLDRLRARTVLGRPGRPDELAGALVFLASGASSYVTGHALVVDGGWTIT